MMMPMLLREAATWGMEHCCVCQACVAFSSPARASWAMRKCKPRLHAVLVLLQLEAGGVSFADADHQRMGLVALVMTQDMALGQSHDAGAMLRRYSACCAASGACGGA